MARELPLSPRALTWLVICAVFGLTSAASTFLAAPAASMPSLAPAPAACPTFPGAAAFVSRIDNRYMPLIPGTIYTYSGREDGEKQRNTVEVTHDSKTILGIQAVVVLDTVYDSHGGLIEQTFDWFGQDNVGNVWYLGEDTKEFENGQVVSTTGSWEAGVNGGQPGIVMEAQPKSGDAYKQECASPDAVDAAQVLGLNSSVKIPFGNFGNILRTRETSPLEPGVAEDKLYAPCVGLVRVVTVKGGHGTTSLVDVQNGPSPTELGCSAQQHHKHKDKHHRHKHRH